MKVFCLISVLFGLASCGSSGTYRGDRYYYTYSDCDQYGNCYYNRRYREHRHHERRGDHHGGHRGGHGQGGGHKH